MILSLAIAALFFVLLLGSSALIFGPKMGNLARGAAVPLLVIPLATDWIRFAGNIPFSTAWLTTLALYATCLVICAARVKWMPHLGAIRRYAHWKIVLLLFLILALTRLWPFTGTFPNPADDIWGGYKAGALFHAQGWPARHPEVPQVTFSYYYFAFSWPAGLALLGINFMIGWVSTAVVIGTAGAWLAYDVIRPRTATWYSALLIAILLLNGATFAPLLDIFLRMPPRLWGTEISAFLPPSLNLNIPQQTNAFWMPFVLLGSGLLLQTFYLILQQWRHRTERHRLIFVVLALGALAGYCTFYLLGFLVVALPLLLFILARKISTTRRKQNLIMLAIAGIVSALAAAPQLILFAQREYIPNREQYFALLPWLFSPLNTRGIFYLFFLLVIFLLIWILSNPLGIIGLFTRPPSRRPLFSWLCSALFVLGTAACFFGIVEDFTAKFGAFVSLCGAFLFFQIEPRPRWQTILFPLSLVVSAFMLLNCARANFTTPKLSQIWKVIDRESQGGKIPVYYENQHFDPVKNASITPNDTAPFFNRARFIVPANKLNPMGFVYMGNPSALQRSHSTHDVLQQNALPASHYLYLTCPPGLPRAHHIYRDEDFQLSLEPLNP